jgi:hypothetical protein
MASPPVPSQQTVSLEGSFNSDLISTLNAYIATVRAKMRDYPELNRLTDGKESSDREIAMALLLALDDYNNTPPLLDRATLVNFPSKSLLIDGAIIQLLESLGLLQTRNQMQYSDGQGVVSSVSEKPQMIMQWLNLFKGTHEQKKLRVKMAINLNGALGFQTGTDSEYLYINGYFNATDYKQT